MLPTKNINQNYDSSLICIETFVPFEFADPAGIVFYGIVFSITHSAFEQFVINQLQIPWREWFQNETWIAPIKYTEASYSKPLFAGKNCQTVICQLTLSRCSFSIHYQIEQEGICATVKTVHVFCDKIRKEKIEIPSAIRSKLLQFSTD